MHDNKLDILIPLFYRLWKKKRKELLHTARISNVEVGKITKDGEF